MLLNSFGHDDFRCVKTLIVRYFETFLEST
ncbi:hypothetical protein F3S07_14105 [Vibrio alginolyticus]|uniref:Uncharacterized protein n=1 Tax=Vibrio chemaguriensis TaxID=2527672 RepID=A0ABX1HSQ9_9VIBR|nr:hypothetical protein AL537_20945 [Vibrio diabolicus]AVF63881.1 hypothetical protein AL541_05955 [Vibrio alginolyticus]NAW94207.1 hypothetical protein [Vibrio sp. V42_P2S4T144]NKJ67179.1 hypothetical protein [Vibrio chemaguriensis]NNN50470.1 hypothetical protein [Vibrio sp. 2-2(7)]NNN63552.1 hypothetical protein [Vibrio sp. 2-1(7)]NNN87354.1 hypothetical protein [Vibrio sp. 2-2(9)]QCO88066.1 hypothetical protein D3H41_18750 [Vibrio neocaledonicus]